MQLRRFRQSDRVHVLGGQFHDRNAIHSLSDAGRGPRGVRLGRIQVLKHDGLRDENEKEKLINKKKPFFTVLTRWTLRPNTPASCWDFPTRSRRYPAS